MCIDFDSVIGCGPYPQCDAPTRHRVSSEGSYIYIYIF